MKKKLGELLVDASAATPDQVKTALGLQRAYGETQRLGDVLVSLNVTTPDAVARALAQQFNLPFIELPNIPAHVSALVPTELQSEHRLVPFRLEQEGRVERLLVAVADPERMDAVDELRFQLGKQIRVYVASAAEIDDAIAALRGEKLEEIEPVAIDEEEDAGELPLERTTTSMVAGNWFGPAGEPAEPPAGDAVAQANDDDAAVPDEWTLAEPSLPDSLAPMPLAAPSSASSSLDELLGVEPARAAPPSKPPQPPATIAPANAAKVVRFGGAASSSPVPVPGTAGDGPRHLAPEFSEQDLMVLDTLEALSRGEAPLIEGEKIKPERLVATMLRLLLKKGVIDEQEFLEELARK